MTLGEQFASGLFTHFNRTIERGTSIDAAALALDVSLDFGGESFVLAPVFLFDHWVTHNQAEPCADGAANGVGLNVNGCADRVDIFDNAPPSSEFVVHRVTYVLEVTGFLVDGTVFDVFWTREAADNGTVIRARLVALPPEPIPLPAGGWLLAVALAAGLALRRTRRTP